MMIMPNIKPVSYLSNYTKLRNEVKENSPVYLTRNGKGKYAIIKLIELDRLKSTNHLLTKLRNQQEKKGGFLRKMLKLHCDCSYGKR